MKYTTYNPITGQIIGTISVSNDVLLSLNLHDQPAVEGEYNGQEYYVSNGTVVALPEKPIVMYHHYEFDWEQKIWQLDTDATGQNVRNHRSTLLKDIDQVNVVWYNSLSPQQQQQLAEYRQSLLDVPQQTGFPTTVEWPAKPAWL